jgi:3-hydroxyacyl-CoA dehydrogenase
MMTDVRKAVTNADIVIEAIVENVDVKRRLFAEIENASPKYAMGYCTTFAYLVYIMF